MRDKFGVFHLLDNTMNPVPPLEYNKRVFGGMVTQVLSHFKMTNNPIIKAIYSDLLAPVEKNEFYEPFFPTGVQSLLSQYNSAVIDSPDNAERFRAVLESIIGTITNINPVGPDFMH